MIKALLGFLHRDRTAYPVVHIERSSKFYSLFRRDLKSLDTHLLASQRIGIT
jgi:hypothetical protein